MNRLLSVTIPAEPARLKELRDAARGALREAGVEDSMVERLVLALGEACMNIVQHGYAGSGGEIALEILDNREEILFRLRDWAPPVNPVSLYSRALDDLRPGGLGLRFMRDLMDRVEYLPPPEGRGNLLEMRKRVFRT